MEPLLVSIREAAASLNIGLTKTYELIADGQLETVHIGSRRLVRVSSLRKVSGDTLEKAA